MLSTIFILTKHVYNYCDDYLHFFPLLGKDTVTKVIHKRTHCVTGFLSVSEGESMTIMGESMISDM